MLHSLHMSPQNSPSEENKNKTVIAGAGVLTGHNGCVVVAVEEPQLRQASRHDTGMRPGVWEFQEGGEQGAGEELEVVRVAGAEPIQWAWSRPSELA